MNNYSIKYPIHTLIKAANILDYFIKENRSVTLTELTEALNMYPSAVHRILNTLIYLKYIEKIPNIGKYQLGLKSLELGMAKLYQLDVVKEAEPLITELSIKYNENVYLGTLLEDMVFYQAKKEALNTVKVDTHLGTRTYFNCTALGKVLVAFLPKDKREKIYQNIGFRKFTENTITNKSMFEKELINIRKKGFAIDNEEHERDIQCIAAPIRDYSGKVIAAMSISGPSYRFRVEQQPQLISDVIKYGYEISKRLGYRNEL